MAVYFRFNGGERRAVGSKNVKMSRKLSDMYYNQKDANKSNIKHLLYRKRITQRRQSRQRDKQENLFIAYI
jgi:hypothetical protein